MLPAPSACGKHRDIESERETEREKQTEDVCVSVRMREWKLGMEE